MNTRVLVLCFVLIHLVNSVFSNSNTPDKSPVLKGKVSVSQLMNAKKFKWFVNGFNFYAPQQKILDSLKSAEDYSVVIVMGTWCDDTKEHLPKMIKLLHLLHGHNSKVTLLAVDKSKKISNRFKIFQSDKIPAFYILRNSIIIGKIIESPAKSVEEDLLRIVR